MDQMLKCYMLGMKTKYEWRPWKTVGRYIRCGACGMDRTLAGPSFLEKLPKNEWKGGTIMVPIGTKGLENGG